MSEPSIEELKSALLERLVYSVGKDPEHAVPRDWCVALTLAIRDRIVEAWMASTRKTYEAGMKRVYYLSMEFLIGRLLADTMSNLGLTDVCRGALEKLGIDYDSVLASEPDAALGNGGLGRLAACFLDSMSTLGIAAFGYGIRYRHGLFRQRLADGWQVEQAENWLMLGHPWEFERPESSYTINFGGSADPAKPAELRWEPGEKVIASAYDTPITGWGGRHVNTLRLWTAKPAGLFDLSQFHQGDYLSAAAQEVLAETITRVLYPDDSTEQGRELRLKQEYFFTSASLQDLLRRFLRDHEDLAALPRYVAIQLNDTHPAIAVPELMRLLIDEHGTGEDEAFGITRECLSYTNHTLMPEALERWPTPLFARVLPRHLQLIESVDRRFAAERGARQADVSVSELTAIEPDNGGWIRMGNLAFIGSRGINGVSELHTRLMKETVFKGLHAVYPERIVNVTNGITPRRWLYECNAPLRKLLNETIGDAWVADLGRIEDLVRFVDDAEVRARFAAARRENKLRLAGDIQRRTGLVVSPDALFDVQVKRIHEYKRQLLNALQTVARYQTIRAQPDADWLPVVKIFSGKAAPSYTMAKLIIKLINDIAATVNRDPVVGDRLKVLYVPDYNVSRAEVIIPGADLSEQISTAGMEASGTGNMKLALNGALTVGTLDGANIEIRHRVGAENMFIFGLATEEVEAKRREGHDPRAIIENDAVLRNAVQAIGNGEFSPDDPNRFAPVVGSLYDHDWFMNAADFASYCAAQEQVLAAYRDHDRWWRSAMLNTAGVGWFSSDRAVREYAEKLWRTQGNG
ncbi:MAG TPA: glycogen/starch/alpha-glucan phosphorylase [Woeseiaceae bacterium]|nr:glycogen/starch/alpha-glucan phosphorylase [Woeseiaceae bacterium]